MDELQGHKVNARVKLWTVDEVMQGGFRAGRRCVDQIFAVRQIVEKTIDNEKKIARKGYDN